MGSFDLQHWTRIGAINPALVGRCCRNAFPGQERMFNAGHAAQQHRLP
jgi:hypothetical protein